MFCIFKKKKNKNSIVQLLRNHPVLVDVRTENEFKTGSVPNAINIPLQQLNQHLKNLNKQDDIVVFCRSGNRSGQAKKILERNGFTNVVNGGGVETMNKLYAEANN